VGWEPYSEQWGTIDVIRSPLKEKGTTGRQIARVGIRQNSKLEGKYKGQPGQHLARGVGGPWGANQGKNA